MVKPAAPWFRWGLVLWCGSALLGVIPVHSLTLVLVAMLVPFVTAALALAGSVLLAVGVYRLVQHADRAAGVVPRLPVASAGISDDERARQAEARAALAAAAARDSTS